MTDYVPPKKNDANGYIFYTALSSRTADGTFLTNPTLATGDVKVSIDGAAFANLGTLPAVTPAAGIMVKVTLAQAEINGDNISIKFVDAAGAEWCDKTFNFQTATRQLQDLAYPVTSGRSMVVDAAGLVDANAVKVGPTGAGTAQTARDIGASVLLSSGTGTGQVKLSSGYVAPNWGDVGNPTTTVGLTNTTVGILTTYTGNTVQTGDSFARIGAAGVGLTNVVLPSGGLANVSAWTVAITGNITGNLSGSVGSVTGAVGSVTGAVGSVTGAVGSVTGNVGGNVTGSVGSLGATAKTDVSTAVLTTQMTESYAANGVAPTLAQAMMAIHQELMDFTISGTSYTVKKLNNSSTAFVVTLDSATTPTAAART